MNFKKITLMLTVALAVVLASGLTLAANHTNSTNTTDTNTTVNMTDGNMTVNETDGNSTNTSTNETNTTDTNTTDGNMTDGNMTMNETDGNMSINDTNMSDTNVSMNETNMSMNDTNVSMNDTVPMNDTNVSMNETNMTDGNVSMNETDGNTTDNETEEPETGLEDFGEIKNAFLSGELSEGELQNLIANNRFPPGILNVLLRSGQLSQETIDIILDNQDLPKGILDRFLGFFGIERNSMINNLVENNDLSASNVENLVSNFDVPKKDLKKAVSKTQFRPEQAQRITQAVGDEEVVQEVIKRTLPPQAKNKGKSRDSGSLEIGSQSKGNGRTATIKDKVKKAVGQSRTPPGQAKKTKSDDSEDDRRGPSANIGSQKNSKERGSSERRGPPNKISQNSQKTPPGLAKGPKKDIPGKGRGRN